MYVQLRSSTIYYKPHPNCSMIHGDFLTSIIHHDNIEKKNLFYIFFVCVDRVYVWRGELFIFNE